MDDNLKSNVISNDKMSNYASQEPKKMDDSKFVNYKNWPWTEKEEDKVDLKYTTEPNAMNKEFRQKHTQLFNQYHKCLSDTKCETECDKYLEKAVWLDSKFKDSLY
jgi:hypothetical protein